MSKPWIHAKSSSRKYGGVPDDYIDIHQFMDSSKASLADVRHRALLHSSFGCFITEKVFGVVRKNSDGKEYSVRDIAEDHCMEDLGFIPSVEKWLGNMTIQTWMGGPCNKNDREKKFFVPMDPSLEPNKFVGANSSISEIKPCPTFDKDLGDFRYETPVYYDGPRRQHNAGTEITKLPDTVDHNFDFDAVDKFEGKGKI
jgi:hypothetical protein